MNQIFGNQSKSYLELLVRQGNNSPKNIGYQKLTVDGTVDILTIPSGSTFCQIRLESSVTSGITIRYRMDGTDPTSTDGMGLSHLESIAVFDAENMTKFKAIQAVGGVHILHILYFK